MQKHIECLENRMGVAILVFIYLHRRKSFFKIFIKHHSFKAKILGFFFFTKYYVHVHVVYELRNHLKKLRGIWWEIVIHPAPLMEYLPHPISAYSPVLRRLLEYLPYTIWCKKNAPVNIHKTQADFEYSLRGIRTLHSKFWNKNWRITLVLYCLYICVLFIELLFLQRAGLRLFFRPFKKQFWRRGAYL